MIQGRAPKYCSHPDGCTELVPGGVRCCPTHSVRWDGRTRRRPRGWGKIRLRILKRDRWTCCVPGCGARAVDVDHIDNLGSDDDDNLWSLCRPHHEQKTQAEAMESRLSSTPVR